VSVEEHNKALVRRFLDEVYNRGNLDIADELLSADYIDHTVPPGKYAGREGLKRSVAKPRASSSDLHISIEEQIAEGDKVVSWAIGSGTHDRESFMGLAPTGERMTMKHIFISRLVEDRIVEQWGVSDISSVWQQRLQERGSSASAASRSSGWREPSSKATLPGKRPN